MTHEPGGFLESRREGLDEALTVLRLGLRGPRRRRLRRLLPREHEPGRSSKTVRDRMREIRSDVTLGNFGDHAMFERRHGQEADIRRLMVHGLGEPRAVG